MTRIRRLSKDEVPEEVRELFRTIGNQRGNVPNMFRIHAHRPEILRTMMAHLSAVTSGGTVSTRLKELVATKVSILNECHYWMRSHSAQAVRHGATEDEIDGLRDHENGPFTEAEKAAFAWAEAMTRGNGHVDDATFARLAAHWGEGEMVEITEMAALFNYFNRVANSLQIHPTRPGEGL